MRVNGYNKFKPWYAGMKQQGGSSFSPLSLWQKYYPQAIEFASIIDQSINEEWPQ